MGHPRLPTTHSVSASPRYAASTTEIAKTYTHTIEINAYDSMLTDNFCPRHTLPLNFFYYHGRRLEQDKLYDRLYSHTIPYLRPPHYGCTTPVRPERRDMDWETYVRHSIESASTHTFLPASDEGSALQLTYHTVGSMWEAVSVERAVSVATSEPDGQNAA